MKLTLGLFVVVSVFVSVSVVNAAPTDPPKPVAPELPIFESWGNIGFTGNTGAAWWNFRQYEDHAYVDAGAFTRNRVIGVGTSLTVDRDDTSRFMFNTDMRFLDGTKPTGKLNFSQYSSSDICSASLNLQDRLQDIYQGWDYENDQPIYTQEMQAQLNVSVFAQANITQIQGNSGRWTSEWWDENGPYFSQSGGSFYLMGIGNFIGSDPTLIGKQLVDSGAATYGIVPTAVPEPASIGLVGLALGSIMLRRRSRQH